MDTVSSADFERRLDLYERLARLQPVRVTFHTQEALVLLAESEFRRLKSRDREVLTARDFSEADLEVVRTAEPPREATEFDHEVRG